MRHFFTLFSLLFSISAMAQNNINYPFSEKQDIKNDYFGTTIKDPYRWLEDDNAPETKAWVDKQNEVTQAYLKNSPMGKEIVDELTQLWNYTKYSSPFKKGDYYYFYKNDGLQNQAVLYQQKGLEAEPVEFLNPNTMNAKGTSALGSLSFSKNYKYVAYSVSEAGSDWQDIFVMEVKTKKIIDADRIGYTKFGGATWKGDEGFYYSGYDKPKIEAEKFSAKTEFQKIFFHKLGTSQNADKLIYEDKSNPLIYKGVGLTEDGRFLILSLSQGTDGSELKYWDLNDKNQKEFALLFSGYKYNYDVIDNVGDRLLVYTNHNAENYQVISIDPKNTDPKNWKTIIAQIENKLDQVSLVGNHLFCSYLVKASTQVIENSIDGKPLNSIDLEGIGTASGFGGSKNDDHTFYTFTSFNKPPTIYKYDIKKSKSEVFIKPEYNFNTDNMIVEQQFATSEDGTQIPYFIVRRNDIQLNEPHPVLMYGYGGFNISLTPSFSIPNYYFVQKGGIYVMVNLRGGSEFGEFWHQGGMLKNKQNVFNDFITTAEQLIAQKTTTKEMLAISGRSNGGLLVGACMTQRPDLFKVALPGVGVLDMLRYHKFTVGWGWVVEYGSSDKQEDFNYLIKYSPLHNLKKGTTYPATMITTADHDDRVVPAHSFKFAATLQEMNDGKNPTLIRIDKQAGHGAGKPTQKVIEEYADMINFIVENIGKKHFQF